MRLSSIIPLIKMKMKRSAFVGKSRRPNPALLFLILLILVSCNFPIKDISFITHPYATLDPRIFETGKTAVPPFLEPTAKPTEIIATPPTVDLSRYHVYPARSGDTLDVVARHFRVSPLEITSPAPVPRSGIIPPGQYLVIPITPDNRQTGTPLLPDSAVTNSPCSDGFDMRAFIDSAGGYLSTFSQTVAGERISGTEVVQRVADNQSVSPRLLLAFIEYRSGLVYNSHEPSDIYHPLQMNNVFFKGLYQELSLTARLINSGYYGWRYGELNELTFNNQVSSWITSDLNAGSVGLQYLFANLYPSYEWEERLLGSGGFIEVYLGMFEDPMLCAARVEPLLAGNLEQPQFELPFAAGEVWAYTAGPHYSWVEGTPLGALDFAPNIKDTGCDISPLYARAVAPGVITRSDNGVVILTLIGEDQKPTGWEILYLHVAAQDRVPLDAIVNVNDPIGHPSCEGGSATGTHVHIARKFKGEWISSSGLIPFMMSGWTALPGAAIYTGSLVKDGQVITARQGGNAESLITR